MTEFDCTQFPEGSRQRAICEGTSGLPETGPGNTREAYIALWSKQPQPKPAEPLRTCCVYRGEQIDWVECQTCQDKKVQVRVFQCQLFSRCVLAGGTSERYCGTCESRLESVVGDDLAVP
jgi:hypothetical protein